MQNTMENMMVYMKGEDRQWDVDVILETKMREATNLT